MDYHQLKSGCLILPGRNHELEEIRSAGFHLTDLDMFFENLSLWTDKPAAEVLFSAPIHGIRQFLPNIKNEKVGMFGDSIEGTEGLLIAKYTALGYNVLLVEEPPKFFPASPSCTKITLY